ncbi:hypothetical protein KCU67_g7935, partial [Aureobasidium melanogenum]
MLSLHLFRKYQEVRSKASRLASHPVQVSSEPYYALSFGLASSLHEKVTLIQLSNVIKTLFDQRFSEKAKRAYPESRVRLCPTVGEFGKDNKTLAGYCNLATTGQLRAYLHPSQDWVIHAIKPCLQSINGFGDKIFFNKGPILNQFHQRANTIPGHTPVIPIKPTGDERTDNNALQHLTVSTLKYMLNHSLAGIFWMSQDNCPFELKKNDWRSFSQYPMYGKPQLGQVPGWCRSSIQATTLIFLVKFA